MENKDETTLNRAQIVALLEELFERNISLPIPEPAIEWKSIPTQIQENPFLDLHRENLLAVENRENTALGMNDGEESGLGFERILALLSEIRSLIAERNPEYL